LIRNSNISRFNLIWEYSYKIVLSYENQLKGENMNYCEKCNAPYAEKHHIIFKSQAKYLENVPLNFKYLCPEHHRGKYSPHMDKRTDIKYKQEYQENITNIININKYYNEEEIKDKLSISNNDLKRILKKLNRHKEGYWGNDLIVRLLGNRTY